MNVIRIRAVLLHSWYHFTKSRETWVDIIWFPLVSVLVFGFMSQYLGEGSKVRFLLLGFLLWQVITAAQYSVTMSALWEIWGGSLSSLFITPLTLGEFVLAQMLSASFKALAVFAFTSGLAWLLYGTNILTLGPMLALYLLELMVFGWSAGMFILGLILRYGTNIQSLAWGLIFVVEPLAGVFYPVDALPAALRWLALLLPPTSVFEAARSQFTAGIVPWGLLLVGTALNAACFLLAALFLWRMFHRAKESGMFAKLEG
ncbi:ABC transporter permease [Candidatus Woesearchaeota archaeon]|nr:ABC transporter permease [Candidatus Woesearchaeota archaeon]